jgi:tRNA dimethylallyltransferase
MFRGYEAIALLGPTGSGKSELAVGIARLIGGEIVNADAFQVYKGLTIATAAPSEALKKEVPHHLYGFIPLSEGYDIHAYQKDARAAIKDISSRRRTPILVGGSGLYVRSALYDYDLEADPSTVDLSKYEAMDDDELHAELEKLDPDEAKKIHKNNRRRVLRAIAICLSSGESKTSLLSKQKHEPIMKALFLTTEMDRAELYEKINARVDKMFADGLLEETVPLIKEYGREAPAFRAIGVKELFPYLDGKATLEETKELIKKDTRNYVKRQETFIRHQFEAHPIHAAEEVLSYGEGD